MKRYFSHNIFIYPNVLLNKKVVELDDSNRLIKVFEFEKEIERTQFYSELIILIPVNISVENIPNIQNQHLTNCIFDWDLTQKFKVYYKQKDAFILIS